MNECISSKDDITVICSYCGRLLRGSRYWEKEELSPREISMLPVSHGICSDCLNQNFPDESTEILKKQDDAKVSSSYVRL